MNNVFSQSVGKLANNETSIHKNKCVRRKWHISKGPIIVSFFLTLMLLCVQLTTAVSGGIDALPAAYSHHASGRQSIVQSQHIVVPAPITPTRTPQRHKVNIK